MKKSLFKTLEQCCMVTILKVILSPTKYIWFPQITLVAIIRAFNSIYFRNDSLIWALLSKVYKVMLMRFCWLRFTATDYVAVNYRPTSRENLLQPLHQPRSFYLRKDNQSRLHNLPCTSETMESTLFLLLNREHFFRAARWSYYFKSATH